MKLSDIENIIKHIKLSPIKTMFYLFVIIAIGVAGIWAGGFFGEIGKQQAESQRKQTKPALLEIVDIMVKKYRAPNCVVDLKLLNSGERTAFLTEVSAEVLERKFVPIKGKVEPSANYELLIDTDINIIEVSHDIKPNDVDRLLLTLGAASHNLLHHIKLQLRLKYNGDKEVLSRPFEVSFY